MVHTKFKKIIGSERGMERRGERDGVKKRSGERNREIESEVRSKNTAWLSAVSRSKSLF